MLLAAVSVWDFFILHNANPTGINLLKVGLFLKFQRLRLVLGVFSKVFSWFFVIKVVYILFLRRVV